MAYCPDRGNPIALIQELMNILPKIAFLSAMMGMASCGPLLTSEFISGEGLMYEGYEGTTSGYAPSASYSTDYDKSSYDSANTLYYSNSAPTGWLPPPQAPDLRQARPRRSAPPRHAHQPSPRGIHQPKELKGPKGAGVRASDRHFRKGVPKPPHGKAKPRNPPHGSEAPNRGVKPAKEHENH